MNVDALTTYVGRRLGDDSVSIPATRAAQILDATTDARDKIVQAFANAAPVAVREFFNLEVDVGNDRLYNVPAAKKDPYRIVDVRAVTTQELLEPSAMLNNDGGHYRWRSIRILELADAVEPPGGVEVQAVLHRADLAAGGAEATVGLPTTMHRLCGKLAALLMATVDEAGDGSVHWKLYKAEAEELVEVYGSFDDNQGAALRHALLANYGAIFGDSVY